MKNCVFNFDGKWIDQYGNDWIISPMVEILQLFPFIGVRKDGFVSPFSQNGVSPNDNITLMEKDRNDDNFGVMRH